MTAFDDLFEDGRQGLKATVGDARALAAALAKLLDDPELAKRMGRAGLKRAEAFSAEEMAGRFERLLRVICPHKPGGP